ncbi:hypothetical protein AMK22_09555 [Streptomyces sp. CB01580]|nr:hypothetical protein AMK22_09555 [Streptomyces sp. CB01580]
MTGVHDRPYGTTLFRTPGAPYTSVFALAFIGVAVVMTGIDEDTRISLYCAPLWAVVLGLSYRMLRGRAPVGAARGRP